MNNSLIAPDKKLGYSKIYIDFLEERESAKNFYLSPDLKTVADSLDKINYNRESIVAVLKKQNENFNASEKTFKNIEKLKQPNAVCLFSGQQACLFSGPLLVILKALAIVKAAELYEKELNRPVVPIFWIAGDDHDFEEANHTFILNRDSEPVKIAYETEPPLELPTSEIQFSDEVELHKAKQLLKDTLGETDFTCDLYDLIEHAYTIEDTFVTAFGKFMAKLTEKLGLVFFNPGDEDAKQLAKPYFIQILEKQDRLHDLVTKTNKSIVGEGYHIQVEKKDNAAYLFYNLEGRKSILREDNHFKVGDRTFTKDELLECLEKHPQRFSPDVMTRPVMQSFLFPVLSQKGGPAEIAYLAQINPIFEVFDLVAPYYKGRASATVLEKRFEKVMDDFEIKFEELTGDIEQVVNRVMEKSFPKDLDEKFIILKDHIKQHFNEFSTDSLQFDSSLQKFSEQIMGKIDFNLKAFEGKVFSSHKKKSQQTREKIYKLWHANYTNRALQERSLNISYFIAKYGLDIIDKLYESLDSEEKAHQIIKLSELYS